MGIASSTINFLKSLDKNNHREWFQTHKAQYEAALSDIQDLTHEVEAGLNKKDVIAQSKVFRIYRDVRFSKDKTPYKNHFGIHFTRATALRRGGYYLQIEPGKSFVSGGFWSPSPEDLKRIREEFALDDKAIRKILSGKKFQSLFGQLEGEELKTAPPGHDRNHPAIDLIRKKQYILTRYFKDKDVLAAGFTREVILTFEGMRPYLDYMTEVLTTDLNGQPLHPYHPDEK